MARKKSKYHVEHKASKEELANDPSLRFFPYQRGEQVWSDDLREYCRFRDYTADNRVLLSTLGGIAPIAGQYDPLRVRRPRAGRGTGRAV